MCNKLTLTLDCPDSEPALDIGSIGKCKGRRHPWGALKTGGGKKRIIKKKNVLHLLKVHEDSQEHNTHMATWKDLEVVLQRG